MTHPTDSTVTSPSGFRASGVACGLKASGNPDLALLVSDQPCSAAGVFTTNQVVAAPVTRSRQTLTESATQIRAVVINSGNANACTGPQGEQAAAEMQAFAARTIGCQPNQVLIMSTGVIGQPLPVEKVTAGIAAAHATLSLQGGALAAQAMLTTDTRLKTTAQTVTLSAGTVTIGGMAKGAGMIAPNMATMLAVLTTDCQLTPTECETLLHTAVNESFNCIVVDGDMSTNDSVFLLANGAKGVTPRTPGDHALLQAALTDVATHLAQAIVRDGEGARKFVTLTVSGAATHAAAARIAHTIACSPLVKTAFAGSDPNWGRILAAAGRAGVPIDPNHLTLTTHANDNSPVTLVQAGLPLPESAAAAAAVFAQPEFAIALQVGSGLGFSTVWTCDLTHDYITINADYRT